MLLAEDDKLVLGVIRETLESEGWEVVGCEVGTAALAEIEGEGRYDLIITDYRMPGTDGLELVRAARRFGRRSGTPIIMLTASPVEGEARAAGVDLFLRKPEDVGRLAESVKVLLGAD
ncbi:MAG: response regulator [Acidobacteria bacterium]|nr:response regulator [Acidobacteriota bacterium]